MSQFDHTLAGERLSGRPQTWYVKRSTDALGSLREDTVRVAADISHLYRDGHDGHRSLSAASSTPCGAIGIAFMTRIKFGSLRFRGSGAARLYKRTGVYVLFILSTKELIYLGKILPYRGEKARTWDD